MKLWLQIIIEWVNCLGIIGSTIKELKDLEDGVFYIKLIDLLAWKKNKNILEDKDIITKFLQDEFPEFNLDDEGINAESEHLYIASLFLLYISQDPMFHRPMCVNLKHETQVKIKSFLEMVLPHGKDVNRDTLIEVIAELEDESPKTPITPRTMALKDFFNSPAARSAQSHKIMTERNRELRNLRTELEVERFEKVDLQEDLKIQQNKIQILQKKLQEKSAEIKTLRAERMSPNTPHCCKKNKSSVDTHQYCKKEIDRLEDQIMQKQCDIDKLQADNDRVSKQLATAERQYILLREKLDSCGKCLENLQIQGEAKDRELVTLRITNEELRTYIKELNKGLTAEQSFEIDGIAPLNSSLSCLNNSEALSSVIEIQLREARDETASLKSQLDVLNKKFDAATVEHKKMLELNNELQEKALKLQGVELELKTTLDKLTLSNKSIEVLQEEKLSLTSQNEDLKSLCESWKISSQQADKCNNSLNLEISNLKEELDAALNKLASANENVEDLQKDKASLLIQNKDLAELSASRKESLQNAEESNTALNLELYNLKEELKDLQKSLHDKTESTLKLNTALTEAQSQINENLEYIQKLVYQNNTYETSIACCNTNLKEIIHRRSQAVGVENNISEDTTTVQLVEYLETILSNWEKTCASKETEIRSLKNVIEEANLKVEKLSIHVSELEENEWQSIIETSELKETIEQNIKKINELTSNVAEYSETILSLKQVEVHKQTLEEELCKFKEQINEKNASLKSSAMRIAALEQDVHVLTKNFHSTKAEVLNQLSKFQKQNKETAVQLTDSYKTMCNNFNKEMVRRKELENVLAENTKKLANIRNINAALENNLSEKDQTINNLTENIRQLREVLNESQQTCENIQHTKEEMQKHHETVMNEKKISWENLNTENGRLLSELNTINDQLTLLRQEKTNLSAQMNLKDAQIENLVSEVTSLKLEKEHLMYLQKEVESKSKNFVEQLETKLLEKQRCCDQLIIEAKLRDETLQLLQKNFENLTKEKVASELKKKEVILNLQEVRTTQDAVLAAQEKALKEKFVHLEELQKEFNESKSELCKQLEDEKLMRNNLQSTCSELQLQAEKQSKTIEELQEVLKKERDEIVLNKELWKTEDKKKLEIEKICNDLELCVNDLRSTVVETGITIEDFESSIAHDRACEIDDDRVKNIFNIIKTAVNNVHVSRKLISRLSETNTILKKTVEDQKVTVNDYAVKCEEIEILKSKVEELNTFEEKQMKNINNLIKRKESLGNSLEGILNSRKGLDVSLNELQQKWNMILSKFHNVFEINKSLCDEVKHIQDLKENLSNTLVKHNTYHLNNMQPLNSILWEKFLWTEQQLQRCYLNGDRTSDPLDFSDFSEEEAAINAELDKNKILQKNIVESQIDIEDFAKLVASFEVDFKYDESKYRPESEKKLQTRIDELTEQKSNIESKLDCLRIRNAKLEGHVDELRNKITELKAETAPLTELEDLKKDLSHLKEENARLREDRDELNKRPRVEEVDNQMREMHSKYEMKLDEMKLRMKTAYNEQVAKLNREQEKCVQERLESLQKKMEQQCRKQADDISKYKAHISDMSSQLWNVGEKLLTEQQQKQEILKELNEVKAKLQNQQMLLSMEQKPKLEKKDFLSGENADEIFQKIAVIQERTTYERRCSIRSIQTMGNAFNAEDEEGEIFDNIYLADMKEGHGSFSVDPDRLSTLQKRNALCKPHLKSSYPAEMQFNPLPFTEEEIKTGSVPEDAFNDSLRQSLLPEQKTKKKNRTQTSYKKPGPPTPSKNGGRLSLQGNELRSPNSRILRERNKERATATPRTLRSLFGSRRQDENVVVTPRGRRRSSIFRKCRGVNDR